MISVSGSLITFGYGGKATSLKLYTILKFSIGCYVAINAFFSFENLALIKDIRDKVFMSCFMFSV